MFFRKIEMDSSPLVFINKFLMEYYQSMVPKEEREGKGGDDDIKISGVESEAAALLMLDFECFFDLVMKALRDVVNEDGSPRTLIHSRDIERIMPDILRRMRG